MQRPLVAGAAHVVAEDRGVEPLFGKPLVVRDVDRLHAGRIVERKGLDGVGLEGVRSEAQEHLDD